MIEEGEGVLISGGTSSVQVTQSIQEDKIPLTHPEAKMMVLTPVNRSPLVSSIVPSSIRELDG